MTDAHRSPPGPVARWLNTAQPEALFVLAAVAQYVGAAIAVVLFDEVEPQTVAWLRVIGAALAVLLVSRAWWRGWTRPRLLSAGLFGVATALMNTFFYLGLNSTDLAKSVTIEFIGPIAVAAVTTRSGRNAIALVLAAVGVVVLGGGEIGDNTAGIVFLLAASGMWAVYIVVGARVARLDHGVAGLGVGLALGAVAIAPIGAPASGDVWLSPRLLALCLLVGVFSNAVAYGIDQFTLRRIPIRRFSVLLALLPVTATAIGLIALDQLPTPPEFAGIALVVAGVFLQEREELARVERTVRTDPA